MVHRKNDQFSLKFQYIGHLAEIYYSMKFFPTSTKMIRVKTCNGGSVSVKGLDFHEERNKFTFFQFRNRVLLCHIYVELQNKRVIFFK